MFSFSKDQQTKQRRPVQGQEPKKSPPSPVETAPEAEPRRRRSLYLGQTPRADGTQSEHPAARPGDIDPPPPDHLNVAPLVDSPPDDHPNVIPSGDIEEAGPIEIEDFENIDAYDGIDDIDDDDIDDIDAFEQAHGFEKVELMSNFDREAEIEAQSDQQGALAPQQGGSTEPLENRSERQYQEAEQPQPPDQMVANAPDRQVLPPKDERASEHHIQLESIDAAPLDQIVVTRPAPDPTTPSPAQQRRPQISGVHGASLASLIKTPQQPNMAPPDHIAPDHMARAHADDPVHKFPSSTGQPDIEPGPATPRTRKTQNAPTPNLLPTLLIAEVPRLRRFAAAMIGDEGAADQLVQDTLQQALSDPNELLPDRDLNTSLLVILYRLRSEVLERLKQAPKPAMTQNFLDILFQRLQAADRDEMLEFANAIGSLNEEDRAILLLITLENLDYRDVAAIIKVTPGRVMAKVAHAREELCLALQAAAGSVLEGVNTGDQR